MTTPSSSDRGSLTLGLAIAWLVVGLPLAWGVFETLKKAVLLFK